MAEILIPIFVCVVLPVCIVAIVFITAINSDNKRAKVLIKAIEAGNQIDAETLTEAFSVKNTKKTRTPKEIHNLRLLRGCIFSLIGLFIGIIGIVSLCTGCEFSDDAVTVPLFFGGISLAIGLSYLVVYMVTKKQFKD